MSLVSHSWFFVTFWLRQSRRRRHCELLLQRLAPCKLCLIQRGKATPRVLVWRRSWFVFDTHMVNLERLLEIQALMQQGCFVPIPRMIRFFSSVSRCYVGQCQTIWAMFDLLESFMFLFISAHKLCSQYSTMYGKVRRKLLGNCVRPSTFGFLKHCLVRKA